MALRTPILLAAVMAAHCFNIVYGLDQAARVLATELHNTYRQKEGACDMNALKYSAELESEAAEHAEKCRYEHKYADDIGENMAWFQCKLADEEVLNKSLAMWYNEIVSCPKKDWGKCGHYSQVVWAATTLVGCAIKRCNDSQRCRANIFCFYKSPGNIGGQEMYKTNCTKNCTEGKVWIKGLCYDIGSKEAQHAIDSNNNDESSKNKEEESTKTTTTTTTTTTKPRNDTLNDKQGTSSKSSSQDKTAITATTAKPRTGNSNCKDSKSWCPNMAKDCINPKIGDWTKKYCPLTCDVC